jgi:hypothetical protein
MCGAKKLVSDKMRNRSIVVSVGIAVLFLTAGPQNSVGNGASVCHRRGYRKVVESRHARVLEGRHGRHWGCLLSRNRLVALDDPKGDARDTGSRFRLAGRFVGFEATGLAAPDSYDSVVVQNLRNGRVKHSAGVYENPQTHDEDGGDGGLVELRVSSRGSLAWTACPPVGCFKEAIKEVRRFDSRGKKTLDAAAAVRAHSLRVHEGRHITWLRGDERRTATLR